MKDDIVSLGVTTEFAERCIRIMTKDIMQNSALQSCHPQSILGAIMMSMQIGLEPNTSQGLAYIIPRYKNTVACFQIGYQGRMDLFRNDPESEYINAWKVYETDIIEIEHNPPKVSHKQTSYRDRGNVIGYYAIAKLKSGFTKIIYKSLQDIEQMFRENPERFKSDAWKTDRDAMCLKTVITECLAYMPSKVKSLAMLDNTVKLYDPYNKPDIIDMTEYPNKLYEYEGQFRRYTKKTTPSPEGEGRGEVVVPISNRLPVETGLAPDTPSPTGEGRGEVKETK